MDPKPKDPRSGGDFEEITVADKRSRRVSFAETTAVHVFDRDEDFETPPDSKPATEGAKAGSEGLGFQGDPSDSEDSRGSTREAETEEDEDGEPLRFFRDVDSSSPGSAVGSVTSNDDDNFFGPVSTSFIRSGRVSDAGMSDDNNHDITLDSTAFSLHFHNVAPPDDRSVNSAGSLWTPTGEDSVPLDSSGLIKMVPWSKLSNGKTSSSNMSIVIENVDRYDYGKISPTLEALLAEANKGVQPNSPMSSSKIATSKHCNNEDTVVKDSGRDGTHSGSVDGISNGADAVRLGSHLSHGCSMGNAIDPNGSGIPSPNKLTTLPLDAPTNENTESSLPPEADHCSNAHETMRSNIMAIDAPNVDMLSPSYSKSHNNLTLQSRQGTLSSEGNSCRDAYETLQCSVVATDPQNIDMLSPPYSKSHNNLTLQSGQEPFIDHTSVNKPSNCSPQSIQMSPALVSADGQQQLLFSEYGMHTPKNSVQPLQPLPQGSVSSLRAKRQQLFLDPAVLSQTRLMDTPDAEQPLSSLKVELMRHGERISAIKIPKSKNFKSPISIGDRSALLGKDPLSLELKGTLEKINDDPNVKYTSLSAINIKNVLADAVQVVSERNINVVQSSSGFQTAPDVTALTHLEKDVVVSEVADLTNGIPSFQFSHSEINMKHRVSPELATPELKESGQVLDTLCNASSSFIRESVCMLSVSQETCFDPRADVTSRTSSSVEESILQSSTSFAISNSDKVSTVRRPRELGEDDMLLDNSQKQIESPRNFQFGGQSKSNEMKNLVSSKNKLFVRETIPDELALEVADKEIASTKTSMELFAEEIIPGPNNMTSMENNLPHSAMDTVPSKPTAALMLHECGLNYQDPQSEQKMYSVQDETAGKKRGIEQIILGDNDYVWETNMIQKSPRVLHDDLGDNCRSSSGNNVECINEAPGVGSQPPWKHWTDMLSKVSETTRQLFSPLICDLNPEELDSLDDMLRELQIARKYQRLFASLRNNDCLDDLHQKRVAECRSLLDKSVYEKAKLQLKHMKLDQLTKKAQLCKLKIQECGKLKSVYSEISHSARTFQIQETHLHSVSSNSNGRSQVEYNRVTSMRQELEMLDQEVKRLMKSFQVSCNIKGNTNCDGIIKAANDHLEMKNCCRVIQQDSQLWKLSDVTKRNDQSNIVLNYCNLLSQRFTINTSTTPSIVVNNFLNNANIEKRYSNMNACTAFEFVFRAKGDHKLASSTRLQQVTSETDLLLGTLLDVLEEVSFSQMELWNLASAAFYSQRSGHLELHLCFLSFKSSHKVTLGLDMTNLSCAVYPSKPSELQVQILERQTTLAPPISDEIMGAVQSLPSGQLMIRRLCQNISQAVEALH